MNLNDQDKQILSLLADGLTAKEIAGRVNLTTKAVEKRLERMKEKTKVRTKAQLIANFVNSLL